MSAPKGKRGGRRRGAGRPALPPGDRTVPVSAALPGWLAAWVASRAARTGRSRTSVIVEALLGHYGLDGDQ